MVIHIDDSKPFPPILQEPNNKRESFAAMCKRQAAGLKLISDEMEREKKEQEELRKLQEKRFERKKKLLFDNLDLILRHREEILATPRYANIDAHYAIKGGGLYVGPLSSIKLRLGTLLEVWDTDQFKVECKCGGTAVIYYFSGSPLSGASVASAICPECKRVIHDIRNRSFGKYYWYLQTKLSEEVERPGADFDGDGEYCNLETMINELKLKEFEAGAANNS